jgi:DNA-binding GntR family transcriptional regulator
MSASPIDEPPGSKRPTPVRRLSPYERLKQAIISGALAPGEQLVEIPLAEWCEVSRTPIREALTRLEQDGLIQRTEHGLVVRESTPAEIIDLYDSRIVLESRAAAVAAERRTATDLSYMWRAEERYRGLANDDVENLAKRNREFHRAIWVASHNNSLIDLLERLNMHLGRHPLTTLQFPGRHETAAMEHHNLVTVISDQNAELAGKIASQHFTEAQEIRLKILAEE